MANYKAFSWVWSSNQKAFRTYPGITLPFNFHPRNATRL